VSTEAKVFFGGLLLLAAGAIFAYKTQPKILTSHHAGQCWHVPGTTDVKLRAEMKDSDGWYLVRTTPASVYRPQLGYWVSPEFVEQLVPTECPRRK
jgi:hypothetical protein